MNNPSKATFEATARILRDALPDQTRDDDKAEGRTLAVCQIANAFAAEYAKGNPRFDRNRFLTACGVS